MKKLSSVKRLCTTARISSTEENKFHKNVLEQQKKDRKKNKTYIINFLLSKFLEAPFKIREKNSEHKKLVGFHLTVDNMKDLSSFLIDQRALGEKTDIADVLETIIVRWNENE